MENLELEIEKLREELSSIYRDEEKIVHVINTIMEQPNRKAARSR